MKKLNLKYIPLALSIFASSFTFAQSAKPGAVEEIMVDGFKVIYKPATNQVVSARFFIKGGCANYSKDKEGIENLAIALATDGGTAKYSKEEFHRQLEKTGSTIAGNSGFDYSNIELSCIQKYFNNSWNLFEDVINAPLMDQGEFDKKKEEIVSDIKQDESDPDAHLADMVMNDAFANLNYDKMPKGSEESITKLSLADVKDHYKKILNRKQCFLVVVGRIDKNDLIAKVKSMIKNLPEGSYVPAKPTTLNISQSTLNTEDRKMATNYIRGIMNAPVYGTSESYAMQVGFAILGDRLFDEIRTKRSLSYAPAAFYTTNINPFTNIYVSTTDPKQSVQVMIDELKKIKKEGFLETEIKNQKTSYVTTYYMQLETASTQTQSLGSSEVKGSWKNAVNFIDNINKVTPKMVNETFNKYITGIRWSYLGKLDQVDSKVFLQKL
jgi:zinc protease